MSSPIDISTMPQTIPTPLTLIVAATHPHMGIGRASTLPWPSLKGEMAYFARVTRRCPVNTRQSMQIGRKEGGCINAVVMGRKTWESIPERWRPLKGRVNVVVSRRPESLGFGNGKLEEGDVRKGVTGAKAEQEEGPYAVRSLEQGVRMLEILYPARKEEDGNGSTDTTNSAGTDEPDSTTISKSFTPLLHSTKSLSRIFVIGGAEIYATALKIPSCERILLTRVYTNFECDTFFPIKLDPELDGTDGHNGWVKRSKAELDEWVGEDVPVGRQKQGDVEWEYELWEREKEKIV